MDSRFCVRFTSWPARSMPMDLANSTPAVPSQQLTTTRVLPCAPASSTAVSNNRAPRPRRRAAGCTVTRTNARWVLSRCGSSTSRTAVTGPVRSVSWSASSSSRPSGSPRTTATAAGSPSKPCRTSVTKSVVVRLSWWGLSTCLDDSRTATAPATSRSDNCSGSSHRRCMGPANHRSEAAAPE